MARKQEKAWLPVGRGKNPHRFILSRDPDEFVFQQEGFRSKVYSSLADARQQGWLAYRAWQAENNKAAAAAQHQHPALADAAATHRNLAGRKRRPPDSTDGILQWHGSVPTPADEPHAPQAASKPRGKHKKAAAAAAAAAVVLQPRQQQSPSAATDAATGQTPQHKRKKRPAARKAAQKAAPQQPAPRTRRAVAAAAAAAQAPAPAAQPSDTDAAAAPRKRYKAAEAEKGAGPATQAAATSEPEPSSVATAGPRSEVGMSEGEGSNWVAPEAPAGPSAADQEGPDRTMHIWHPSRAKAAGTCLELQLQQQLGKGGFGTVHKVLVKATGSNSLEQLPLSGAQKSSMQALLRRSAGGPAAAAGAAGCRKGSGGGTRQRGGRAGGKAGGSNGAAGGSNSSSSHVQMALKLALPYHLVSQDMQRGFKTEAVYEANVHQRMQEEFHVMMAAAASPHIVDAFCMGAVYHSGSWRPAILMELSELGDAECVFVPAPTYWTKPLGISSSLAQCIVRQAAVGLRDLHKLAQTIHCDIKVSNLLVFGSKDNPQIKLCDFGCAKQRSDEPMYGPASGTKEWQAPEQMNAVAGRLDYCVDSWALGLLVLALRKGKQPFWWLKEQGTIAAERAEVLRGGLLDAGSQYMVNDPPGSALGPVEGAFVQRCMARYSSSRPTPAQLLSKDPYLSSRYRGG